MSLYNAGTRQTVIWYLNNNVFVSGAFGPAISAGWRLVAVSQVRYAQGPGRGHTSPVWR